MSKDAERSTLSKLLPLLLLLATLSALSWVAYQIYLSATQIRKATSEKMDKHNLNFTKEGMKVGVRERSYEQSVDRTQNYVVKAWNLGSEDKGKKKGIFGGRKNE